MPAANRILSAITTGIRLFQTDAGKLNAQIQAAPPTECAVKVEPKLFTNKLSFLKYAITGISQNIKA
ncbi:MAG: hypothetical protein US33_C0040G0003 [Parcubacteria group bacterium GW2011_GWC1_36_9]|nr:MAG: hypothetical protein US33_C0040G0003 [Parcubacteria group bacterium GW2011_GWC1_36_9]